MSASDEVTGLPGGQPLAALAQLVHADTQAIRDIAGSWSEAAGDCEYHTGMVRTAVAEVGQDWKGSSASAFVAFMGRFNGAGLAAHRSLKSAAGTLHWIARTLDEAQVGVEHICENLLSEVARLRAANPRTASPQLNAQITGLATEAADAARAKVDEARQILGQARATLSRELSRLNRTFSALPSAGTQAFAPAAGRPLGWKPVIRAVLPAPATGSVSAARHVPRSGSTPQSAATHQLSASGHVHTPAWTGGPAPPARVSTWIHDALGTLRASGIPAAKLNPNDVWIIIKHESDGNPDAINLTDANAARGDPSKGLMQTISATFNAYALPGHRDVFNPVDNIIAGVRYAIATYGSLDNVPGVIAVHHGQPYVGY